MNKLIKSIAIATTASGLLLASSAMAADQKIAVISFQEVMGQIPQTAAVMKTLEAEFKDERAVLAQLEQDIKYQQEKKKRDGALMSAKDVADLDEKAAKQIYTAIKKKKRVAYISKRWRLVAWALKIMPARILKQFT